VVELTLGGRWYYSLCLREKRQIPTDSDTPTDEIILVVPVRAEPLCLCQPDQHRINRKEKEILREPRYARRPPVVEYSTVQRRRNNRGGAEAELLGFIQVSWPPPRFSISEACPVSNSDQTDAHKVRGGGA
jgi:hypothetical protein